MNEIRSSSKYKKRFVGSIKSKPELKKAKNDEKTNKKETNKNQ